MKPNGHTLLFDHCTSFDLDNVRDLKSAKSLLEDYRKYISQLILISSHNEINYLRKGLNIQSKCKQKAIHNFLNKIDSQGFNVEQYFNRQELMGYIPIKRDPVTGQPSGSADTDRARKINNDEYQKSFNLNENSFSDIKFMYGLNESNPFSEEQNSVTDSVIQNQ